MTNDLGESSPVPNERQGSPGGISVSVIVPTLHRTDQLRALLSTLGEQTEPPMEVIIVDGAPADVRDTESAVEAMSSKLGFPLRYIRSSPGAAHQRNVGIDCATGGILMFVDDDIRLSPTFISAMTKVFAEDTSKTIGGIFGFIDNQHFDQDTTARYVWWKRFRLLTTYEPGRYDRETGIPIGMYGQGPFHGIRPIDFMGTSCAAWRREVFAGGLRFSAFFQGYSILEDTHFALRAARTWKLVQCGDAHCLHLHAPGGRDDRRKMGYQAVVNYRYVHNDIEGPLSVRQRVRFWRFQLFELARIAASAVRRRRAGDVQNVLGRLEGILAVALRKAASAPNESEVQRDPTTSAAV